MKTIEYRLESDPKITVPIPEEYMNLAKKLIKDIIGTSSGLDLINVTREHRCLFNDQINNLVGNLLYANQSEKKQSELRDRVLLDIVMYYLTNDYKAGLEEMKKEYQEKEINLGEAYKNLAGPILKVMERFEIKKTINEN